MGAYSTKKPAAVVAGFDPRLYKNEVMVGDAVINSAGDSVWTTLLSDNAEGFLEELSVECQFDSTTNSSRTHTFYVRLTLDGIVKFYKGAVDSVAETSTFGSRISLVQLNLIEMPIDSHSNYKPRNTMLYFPSSDGGSFAGDWNYPNYNPSFVIPMLQKEYFNQSIKIEAMFVSGGSTANKKFIASYKYAKK